MARPLRIEYEGAVYHVTARGNERRKIYFTKTDYDKFLQYVAEAKKKYGIQIHGYVLMTNHYHLIIETPKANLGRAMHHINSSYTIYLNRKRNRAGHLFQGRYKAILIEKDRYLAEISRYIHLNPVKAKIMEKPEEYPYSSYKAYIKREGDKIVTPDFILNIFSKQKKEAQRKYMEYVARGVGEDLENPLKKVYGGFILGGKKFIKDTLRIIKREYLKRVEISHRKALKAAYAIGDIIDIINLDHKTTKDKIMKTPELRKMAIYLIKRHTGATNAEIGEMFGGISYSAVAKIKERFAREMEENKKLRKMAGKIDTELSNVKG